MGDPAYDGLCGVPCPHPQKGGTYLRCRENFGHGGAHDWEKHEGSFVWPPPDRAANRKKYGDGRMTKNFNELRNKMSPERRERNKAAAQTILHGSITFLCCQCSRKTNDDGSKVTWVCCVCAMKVCRHCTQSFTNDLGIEEYYYETYCSEVCRKKDDERRSKTGTASEVR